MHTKQDHNSCTMLILKYKPQQFICYMNPKVYSDDNNNTALYTLLLHNIKIISW